LREEDHLFAHFTKSQRAPVRVDIGLNAQARVA
jgi:hypothetical protein